jgi:hypothetical protein
MITKSFLLNLAIFSCLQLSSIANAAEPGEGIAFDPITGNYTVSYFVELDDGSKLLQKTIFEPATQIDPSMQSKLRLEDANRVMYRYNISNSPFSRQALDTIRFVLSSQIFGSQDLPTNISPTTETQILSILDANRKALATPLGWNGGIFLNQTGEVRVSWNSMSHTGIQPGNSLAGFGFTSADIPGLGTAELEGIRKRRVTYAGDGPQGDVKQQFSALRQKDFVPRPAAVPTIAVPSPFDPAVTLERIQTHMHTWIGMKLLDATFSAQLDRSFQSAISAYRLNQPKVGKQQIETMRALVKKEQPNSGQDEEHESDKSQGKDDGKKTLIDRLAASVLDFDLQYVTKRMGGDKVD